MGEPPQMLWGGGGGGGGVSGGSFQLQKIRMISSSPLTILVYCLHSTPCHETKIIHGYTY